MRALLVAALLVACSSKDAAPPPPPPPKAEPNPPAQAALEADEDTVQRLCAACHAAVDPKVLNKEDWKIAIDHIHRIIVKRTGKAYSPRDLEALLGYYQARSPDRLPPIAPTPDDSPVRFEAAVLGRPRPDIDDPKENGPAVIHVHAVDLDRDRATDVVVAEDITRSVSWVHRVGGELREDVLAITGTPGRVRAVDFDGDGDRDLVTAVLGSLLPTEQPVGGVVLLDNQGKRGFVARTLIAGLPRVSDAVPADLDGDGDLDVAVAAFGFINQGSIGWLEQRRPYEFVYHVIQAAPGALHAPVVDIDGDGDLDIVTLVAQEVESVIAFVNDGRGQFTARTLFAAGMPTFGSSGLETADLDGDGDPDFVFTNGDAFDVPGFGPRPYHGVHWLENRGQMVFEHHVLAALYGTYGAAIGDLDGDRDLDIAAVSMFNVWSDPRRQSVIWLENRGADGFAAHAVGNDPIHQVTVSIGDVDGDGRNDIITGGIHKLAPPRERMGRVTVWWNRGPR